MPSLVASFRDYSSGVQLSLSRRVAEYSILPLNALSLLVYRTLPPRILSLERTFCRPYAFAGVIVALVQHRRLQHNFGIQQISYRTSSSDLHGHKVKDTSRLRSSLKPFEVVSGFFKNFSPRCPCRLRNLTPLCEHFMRAEEMHKSKLKQL